MKINIKSEANIHYLQFLSSKYSVNIADKYALDGGNVELSNNLKTEDDNNRNIQSIISDKE